MLIDVNLPRILRARGMREREIGALLRCYADHDDGMPKFDVRHELALALGAIHVGHAEYGGEKYNAAIGKGISLVEASLGHNGTQTGTTVMVDGEIPQTAVTALVGRPLRDLVDHPLLPGDERIHAIRVGNGITMADIRPGRVQASVAVRASQMDMALEARILARRRARDVRDAKACIGITPKAITSSAIIIALATLIDTMVAVLSDAHGMRFAAIALSGTVVSAAVMTLLVIRRMRQEDPGLVDRMADLRTTRLAERRRAILEESAS